MAKIMSGLNPDEIAKLLKSDYVLRGVDWRKGEYCYYDEDYLATGCEGDCYRYVDMNEGIDEPMFGVWEETIWEITDWPTVLGD